jgi:hypothetical protein
MLKKQSLPIRGSVQLLLIELGFKVLRLIFGWLLKLAGPILRSFVWPIVRGLLVIVTLIAGIIVIQQVIVRRNRLNAPE